MKRIVPLDFIGTQNLLEPVNRELHDKVVEWCRRELVDGDQLNLAKLQKVWIALDGDTVTGLLGWVWRVDVPVMRATDEESLRMLASRANDFFADQGSTGYDVFIHVAKREKPEQRCPGWAKTLQDWGAESADRLQVKVR